MVCVLSIFGCSGTTPDPGASTSESGSATTPTTSIASPTGDTAAAAPTGDTGAVPTAPSECVDLQLAAGVTEFALPGSLDADSFALAVDGDGVWIAWTEAVPPLFYFLYGSGLFVGRVRCDGAWDIGPVQLQGPGFYPVDGAPAVAMNATGLLVVWEHQDQSLAPVELYSAVVAPDGSVARAPDLLPLTSAGIPLLEPDQPELVALADGTFALAGNTAPNQGYRQVFLQPLDDLGPVGEAVYLAPGVAGNQANVQVTADAGPVVVAWEEGMGLGTPSQVGVATHDGKSVAVDRFEGMEPDVAAVGADSFTAWRTNAWPYVHVAGPGGGVVDLGDPAAPYAVDPTVTAGASRVLVTWRDTFGWEDDVERLAWLDGAGGLLAEEVLHPRGAARTLVGEPLHVGSDTFLVIVEESGAPPTVLGRFLTAP